MADEQPVLAGSGVTLRPFRPEDVDAVLSACQDPEIPRWTSVPAPYRREDAVSYVEQVAPAAWDAGGGVFAVEDTETGALAGTIGAQRMIDGIAHVGYWTAASARGRGLTSEALRVITRWFLDERGASRVELIVEPENEGSVRVAQAAGFRREGVLRGRMVVKGRRADVVMYAVLPGAALSFAWRGAFADSEVDELHAEAFETRVSESDPGDWRRRTDEHSLGWVIARDAPGRLVGFVNVVWDGGAHAWIQDVMVEVTTRRQGVGEQLVARAAAGAKAAGCTWLHVDFEADLRPFYVDACGFLPTSAGLLRLQRPLGERLRAGTAEH